MDDLKQLLEEKGIDASSMRELYATPDGAVYALTRSGAEASDAWFALRDALGGRGWWPVILGNEAGLARIAEDMESNFEDTPPRRSVSRGLSLDVDAWLARREHGDWPDEAEWDAVGAPNHDFSVPFEVLTEEPHERVVVALVPAAEPWEAAAWLGIGGWNDCPNPHEHVALHRSWHERYGAEMATYSRDVVELHVRRPVTDADEAMRVAREHYVYCTDIVDQGTGTMQVLADSLLGATVWYFWWD